MSLIKKIKGSLLSKLTNYLHSKKIDLVYYTKNQEKKDIFQLISQIKKDVNLLLTYTEAFNIFKAVRNVSKVSGELAEVGSYEGGSAKLIAEAENEKQIYLFDTFEGLPEVSEFDADLKKGDYSAIFDNVQDYLKGYNNITIYKGLFTDTSESIRDKKFSFVHLDVDTYQSTLSCIEFFYERLSSGGIMISHDYGCGKGVTKAFDEFFCKKPEVIIELPGSQCLIVKI
jgi:hypothetical protein